MKPRTLRIGRTLGKASLLVVACLLILSCAISVTPRRAGLANEIQAIHAVVSIHSAQAQRLSTSGPYAMTLQELRDWLVADKCRQAVLACQLADGSIAAVGYPDNGRPALIELYWSERSARIEPRYS